METDSNINTIINTEQEQPPQKRRGRPKRTEQETTQEREAKEPKKAREQKTQILS